MPTVWCMCLQLTLWDGYLLILIETQDIPWAHTDNPAKVKPRTGSFGGHHFYTIQVTPKTRRGVRGPSCLQGTGVPKTLPCTHHIGHSPWMHQGSLTFIWDSSKTGISCTLTPTSTFFVLVARYVFFMGSGSKPNPNQTISGTRLTAGLGQGCTTLERTQSSNLPMRGMKHIKQIIYWWWEILKSLHFLQN